MCFTDWKAKDLEIKMRGFVTGAEAKGKEGR